MLEAFILLNCQFCEAESLANPLKSGFEQSQALANDIAFPTQYPVAAAPSGWLAVPVSRGITAYVPPEPESVIMASEPLSEPATNGWMPMSQTGAGGDSESDFDSHCDGCTSTRLDGTRHPYISEISMAALLANPIAPGKYVWTGIWQGEGYGRDWDGSGQLVAGREGGADIQLSILYDSTVTDPTQPNLIITVESNQDQTGQLTDLSAFLIDPQTGQVAERQDFAQLPPIYEVILTRAAGFGEVDIQILEPMAMVSFIDHVSPEQLQQAFPLKLQGINKLAGDRLWEIQQLEAQGWVVDTVPPPVDGDRVLS